MGLRITGRTFIEKNIEDSVHEMNSSLEKLSSGIKFTRQNPMPVDRALSDRMKTKMHELNSAKRNINDGVSMIETADSALSEISNITLRLSELAKQSLSPSLSDKERQFLFIEYKALYDEIDRITDTTSFSGYSLLRSEDSKHTPEIRLSHPSRESDSDTQELHSVKFNVLEKINTTSKELGIVDVTDLLDSEDGTPADDVIDIFTNDYKDIQESFDQALDKISSYRAEFGAASSRLYKSLHAIETSYENIAAANSRLIDVDYASEVANLTRANILVKAGISLLSQANSEGQGILTLINHIDR